MLVELPLEEHLRMECWARSLSQCGDTDKIAKLCSALLVQLAYKDKLLKQAVSHIADLEYAQFK